MMQGWIRIAAGITLIAMILLSGCTAGRDGTTPAPTVPATTTAPPARATPDYSPYENRTYAFRLDRPSEWMVLEGGSDSIVAFISPSEGADDSYRERFYVNVEESTLGIDDYMAQRISRLRQNITYFDQMQLANTRLDGKPARKFVYTGARGMQRFRWVELITMRDTMVYIFTFQDEDGHDSIQIRERVFDSVELTS